jgi:F-type H+-transporting ATPase subunit a
MFLLASSSAQDHVRDHVLWSVDGTPILTLHMVTLVVAAALALWAMLAAARAISTGPASQGNRRYLTRGRVAQLVEVMVVYLRDQMIQPVLGARATNRYLPYLLTVFFFILANNLLGLVPLGDLQHLLGLHDAYIGGTATSNIAVTGALALVSLVVIQVHGLRELGLKGWVHHLLGGAPWWLFPLMVPVELAGHIIKPAALAIRLFANMVAGHTLLATLMLFGYTAATKGSGVFAVLGISVASGLFALAISFLELFVAVLQAFIFMFLTAVFLSLMSHHDDHEAHHAEDAAHSHAPEPGTVPAHA